MHARGSEAPSQVLPCSAIHRPRAHSRSRRMFLRLAGESDLMSRYERWPVEVPCPMPRVDLAERVERCGAGRGIDCFVHDDVAERGGQGLLSAVDLGRFPVFIAQSVDVFAV